MKMSNFIYGLIIALLIIFTLGFAQADTQTIKGKARVIDGDTIEINGEKIRLACIDTPESNYRGKMQYCLDNETKCGELAKQALENMIGDSDVRCEYEKRDIYNRILGTCQIYSRFYNYPYWESFNYKLLEEGYAWYYNGGKECKNYKSLFETAQKEGYGLFDSEIGGFKEPKLWRKTRSND